MPHDQHVLDGKHLELDLFGYDALMALSKGWRDPYGLPTVVEHEGVHVVRDDMITGTKCRFADLLVKETEQDTLVYIQPRVGLAGISLLEVAKRYNKRVVLFMPASNQISEHQAVAIERGAIPKFRRIAAMPNLKLYARQWAEKNDAFFIPLGLQHPKVVSCGARVAMALAKKYAPRGGPTALGEPEVCFVATSTGVLIRGLQIGWPNAKMVAVAVARNLKSGELGRASVVSHPLEFNTPVHPDDAPPYPSVRTYDAKAWSVAREYARAHSGKRTKNVWLWNVGKDPVLKDKTIYGRVDSSREWGEEYDSIGDCLK